MDASFLDPIAKHRGREADDADRQVFDARFAGFAVERDPDVGRKLRANAMDDECSEQAGDRARYAGANHRHGVELGDFGAATIKPAADLLGLAAMEHSAEAPPGQAGLVDLTEPGLVRSGGALTSSHAVRLGERTATRSESEMGRASVNLRVTRAAVRPDAVTNSTSRPSGG